MLQSNGCDLVDNVRITMKYPHGIPFWRTNGELLPRNALSRVVLSSVGTKWNNVVVEQHHFPSDELADVMYQQHVVGVTVGHPIISEFKKEGRLQRVFKTRGMISLFPSRQPFFPVSYTHLTLPTKA